MSKAIAYVRYSTAGQGKGNTIERQESALQAFEERFSVPVEQIISDEGVSSFKGDNIKKGKFSSILEKIEQGEIKKGDFLVVESIDRISRQALSRTATILYGILEQGISIYTTSDERLYSLDDKSRDLENYLMIGLIAKRANEESETKSKRRKSAWDKAKRDAEKGVVFSSKSNTPYGIKIVDGSFEIVEEEAKEIRFIFENLKYEGVSKTVRKLNEFSQREWKARHIQHMIDSKYPVGTYRAQKREGGKKKLERFIPNYYPAIISDAEYYEAVSAMKKRGTRRESGNTSKGFGNIFKHCIKCAKCGKTMIFMKNKNPYGKEYLYFSCESKKESKTGCDDQYFKYEYVLGTFLYYIEVSQDKKDRLSYLLKEKENKEEERRLQEEQESLARIRSELENLEKEAGELERVPSFLYKKMSELEISIEEKENLIGSINIMKESIGTSDVNEIIEMIKTEEGRVKMNKFVKDNNIVLSVEYIKSAKFIHIDIYEEGKNMGDVEGNFGLRNVNILAIYGIENFAKYL